MTARELRRVTRSRKPWVSRPAIPTTGGRSFSHVPCPLIELARRRGGSSLSVCGTPFFPRVLIHLVGLDHRVAQRPRPVGRRPRRLLQAVPQRQQVTAADPKLARQAGGGLALGDPAQDQHDLGWAVVRAGQSRLREGVEDAAAVPAAVVDDRVAVAAVDDHAIGLPAPRAGKAAGMQPAEHRVVTLRFIHEFNDGKVHRLLRERPTQCAKSRDKEGTTNFET